MVSVKRSNHFLSLNDLQRGGCDRRGGPHTNFLTAKAHFAKKFAWPQNGDNCLFVSLGGHGGFHAAFLNGQERLGNIALRENSSCCCEAFIPCDHPAQIE